MSKSVWEISLTGDLNGKLVQLTGKIAEFEKQIEKAEKSVSDFSLKIIAFQQGATALNTMLEPLKNLGEGFIRLDKNMKQVKMMTQANDETLGRLKDRANDLAAAYGGDPADAMAGFLNLMNKFGPEIADNEEALTRITSAAFKLSKTMDGDVHGAFEAVTTMANQFGVDMAKPAEAAAFIDDILGKMAKSALVGSSDIKDVSAAMGVMGNASKEAGVKMSESLALVQMLDRFANKKGAEGGTIARNILGKFQKGRFTEREVLAELSDSKIGIDVNKLADNSVPFIDKLKEIKKLSADPALLGKMFDDYNVAPLKSVLANLDELEKAQASIAANTLEDLDTMSSDVMGGIGERISRFAAKMQILKNDLIEPFAGMLPAVTNTADMLQGMIMLAPGILALTELSTAFGLANKWTALMTWWADFSFKGWMKSMAAGAIEMGSFLLLLAGAGLQVLGEWIIGLVSTTAAQLGLNVAMTANPIGALIVGITALIAVAALVVVYWDEIVEGIKAVGRWIVNLIDGAIPGFKNFAKGVLDFIIAPFKWVGKIIDDLTDAFGSFFGSETDVKKRISVDTTLIANADDLTNPERTNPFFSEKKLIKGKGAGGSGEGSATTDRSRFTNVTITIAKLFDKIEIHTGKINESYARVEDELLRVITSATNQLNAIANAPRT